MEEEAIMHETVINYLNQSMYLILMKWSRGVNRDKEEEKAR
jgi:hypothetical protein